MVLIRDFKRRKKAEKKVDPNVFALSPSHLDWWDAFSARITGPLADSRKPTTFESVFRISRKTFDYICSIVNDTLKAKSHLTGSDKKPLSPADQVAIALWRLSSGDSLSNIGDSFGIHQSTVSHATWRFVEAMEERGLHHLRWPSTEAEMRDIKHKLKKISGLPNCCGVIDTTHILMTLSTVDDSNDAWIDQEKNHSMVLQAIIGPNMRFLDVTVGYPGSLSDALVLQSSDFYKLSEERKRLNGKKKELGKGTKLREYIVGDEGFPLLPWLITPFQHTVHDYQVEFNKRHSATLMLGQTALAKLKEMWRIIHGTLWLPDKNKLPRIVFVCCLLHNIVIEMEDKVFDEMHISQPHDKNYSQQICEYASQTGAVLREELSLHLSGYPVTKHLNPHGQSPYEGQPEPSTSQPLPEEFLHGHNGSSIETMKVDVDASQPSQFVSMSSQETAKRKHKNSLVSRNPPSIPGENRRYEGKTILYVSSELDHSSQDIFDAEDEKTRALNRHHNLQKSQKRLHIEAEDEKVQGPTRKCNNQESEPHFRNAEKKLKEKRRFQKRHIEARNDTQQPQLGAEKKLWGKIEELLHEKKRSLQDNIQAKDGIIEELTGMCDIQESQIRDSVKELGDKLEDLVDRKTWFQDIIQKKDKEIEELSRLHTLQESQIRDAQKKLK